ncbi:hypothetical protein ACFWUP_24600 [Nocardia sp. NPDC058658]|uniref:hypothetical protein n=1 Tax=Nocardia sp. NPDC058658 TaxID=3346580 RepID=UPI00364B998C
MKRILVGAGVFAAMMAATTGMAVADPAPEQVRVVADASTGSSDLVGHLLRALSTGSAAECDGIMLDACVPVGGVSAAQAVPVAGSADLASVIGTYGGLIGWMQGGSSSKPYCGGMCPIG